MLNDITIRPAKPEEAPLILAFISDLAEYEKLSHDVHATLDDVQEAIFGEKPHAECLVAFDGDDAVGFAIYFHNFSTFLSRHGIYLGRVPLVMVLVIGTAVAVGNLGGLVLPVVEADQSRFEGMAGNLPLFMTWLTISWVAGAFGEEMIFRAFLLNRFEAVFENLPYPTILAVLAQGAIFGGAHLYNRGILAALVIFSVGSVLGLLYIKFGRNLWPTILGHGFNNSMSFIARFFGG